MVILVRIFLFVFILSVSTGYAAEDVHLVCTPVALCEDITNKFNEVKEEKLSQEAVIERLKAVALDNSIQLVQIYKKGPSRIVVIEKKPIVETVNFEAPEEIDIDQVKRISQLQEGVYFEKSELDGAENKIKGWLEERGFLDTNVIFDLKERENGIIIIDGKVSFKRKLVLDKIKLKGDRTPLLDELTRGFIKSEGEVFSRVEAKLEIDRIVEELKSNGYLNAKIGVKENIKNDNVELTLKVYLGDRVQFSFYGNRYISKEQFVVDIKKALEDGTANLNGESILKVIEKSYYSIGLYNTKVSFYVRAGKTANKSNVKTFFFKVVEGEKIRLTSLNFKGNLLVDLESLEDLFYENASVLSSRDFVDEVYLDNFTNILKDYYLQRGFVFIDVSRPRIVFNKSINTADVSYTIKERQQSTVASISLDGLPKEHHVAVLKELKNQVNAPLNVVELENDLVRALNVLRELGYFYASISNLDSDDVVTYDSNYTRSHINLKFNLGKVTKFENLVLSGNRVTKDKVLLREVTLIKGDIITPEKLKEVRDNVNSLGLFSRVQIIPIVTNKLSEDDYNKTNVVVQVQEKQFGRGEIAPGYRSDIGAKLSVVLTKSNLLGLNDSGTLKFQLNRRFTLGQFDSRRSSNGKHRLEGLAKVNYTFPFVFSFADFSGNFSVQRKRFYAFDADIIRVSPQLTKQFNDIFGATLKYQYERIRQFDATQEKDSASFEIGSLTPSISVDLRDSKVSPRSGAYFGISWEFASPYFGSQRDSDIEINFSKFISRNKFYIPLFDKKFVLAFSASMGVQENYSRDKKVTSDGDIESIGYIPSIKVFRLDGYDLVRGYSDSEINRLDNGEDITEQRIEGKAYFANFKFEPRYYASDTLVMGPFFDAGRLYVNDFEPTKLRTSAGLTFKILTPVGTLDFDYGVKLQRKNIAGTGKESFGRFHLSIGYF